MSNSRKSPNGGDKSREFPPARQSHGELDDCLRAYSIKPDLCIKAHNWRLYIYSSRVEAEQQLALIKKLIGEKHADLMANACVIQTRQYPDTPYRFRLSAEQHQALKSIRYSDRLVKSLRWDENCFFDKFIHDITHVAPKEVAPRHPLRHGNIKNTPSMPAAFT